MFLTNNFPDLCFLTLCIKIRQNNLYFASLPRISANSNENYTRYNFQALTNISGNIKFPENLQPYMRLLRSFIHLLSLPLLTSISCDMLSLYFVLSETLHKYSARVWALLESS